MEDTLIEAYTDTRRFTRPQGLPKDLRHVRVYPEAPGLLALQVRSRRGSTGYIAHVTLGPVTALAVRDALSAWLEEQQLPQPQQPSSSYRVEPYGSDELGNITGYAVIDTASGLTRDRFPVNVYDEDSCRQAWKQAHLCAGLPAPPPRP